MFFGPYERYFAWHPVRTEDWGWKWLRLVYRRRIVSKDYLFNTVSDRWSYMGAPQICPGDGQS